MKLPSVTKVIGEWRPIKIGKVKYLCNIYTGQNIPLFDMQRGANVGSGVHRAQALLWKGTLDEASLPPEIQPQIGEIKRWMKMYNWVPLVVEKRLESRLYGYCGKPDGIGLITLPTENKPRKIAMDTKNGVMGHMVRVQVSAYEQLYRENYNDLDIIDKYVLFLNKEAPFKFIKIEHNREDFQFFINRLSCFNYLAQLTHA